MSLLVLLVLVAALLTATSLGAGVFSMAMGGDFDRRHSAQFMVARVGCQGIALVLMLTALFVAN